MTHLTRGLDHLRTGSGPERLGPALAVDVLERLEGAFRAVGAHARLPHLERHPQGGRLHALDQRADEQIHGRHDCVVVPNLTRPPLSAVDSPVALRVARPTRRVPLTPAKARDACDAFGVCDARTDAFVCACDDACAR